MTNVRSLDEANVVMLPRINDPRGNLTFIEAQRHVSFEIKRVYYLYDVPGGESRGGHAHRQLEQLIIAASGSFDVVLDNGRETKKFHLDRSYSGLFVPTMVLRTSLAVQSAWCWRLHITMSLTISAITKLFNVLSYVKLND